MNSQESSYFPRIVFREHAREEIELKDIEHGEPSSSCREENNGELLSSSSSQEGIPAHHKGRTKRIIIILIAIIINYVYTAIYTSDAISNGYGILNIIDLIINFNVMIVLVLTIITRKNPKLSAKIMTAAFLILWINKILKIFIAISLISPNDLHQENGSKLVTYSIRLFKVTASLIIFMLTLPQSLLKAATASVKFGNATKETQLLLTIPVLVFVFVAIGILSNGLYVILNLDIFSGYKYELLIAIGFLVITFMVLLGAKVIHALWIKSTIVYDISRDIIAVALFISLAVLIPSITINTAASFVLGVNLNFVGLMDILYLALLAKQG